MILGLVAMLVIALLAAALLIGSRPRVPNPFGPARNGLIAYDRNGDLYVGDPVTGASTLIVGTADTDGLPAFSPDGTHIAFIRQSPGRPPFDIVVVDASGRDPTVVSPAPMADIVWLDWTPDSRAVIFISPTTGYALQRAAADGSGVTTLVDDMAVDGPVFRPPDGGRILFRGMDSHGVGLYTMRPDGTHLTVLIPPETSQNMDFDLREPRWSPDGTLIAYQRWSDDLGQMRVYVMNADGTGSRPLPHAPDAWYEGWPVWSPDGTRLAIQRIFKDGSAAAKAGIPFALVAADGRADAMAIGPPMSGSGLRIEWSPDGTVLLAKSDTHRQVFIDPGGGPPEPAAWDSTAFPAWQRLAP